MLPRILVAQNDSEFDEYIEGFIVENSSYTNSQYQIKPNEKNSITIDQIRDLKLELKVKTIPRLIIIYRFELATIEAQNALLKTLEEKSTYNIFILYAQRVGDILPTILSRCMVIPTSQSKNEKSLNPQVLQMVKSLENGTSYTFLSESIIQPSSTEDAEQIFSDIIAVLQERVKLGEMKAVQSVKIAMELLTLLQHNNLNHQLALDTWYIRSKKIYLAK